MVHSLIDTSCSDNKARRALPAVVDVLHQLADEGLEMLKCSQHFVNWWSHTEDVVRTCDLRVIVVGADDGRIISDIVQKAWKEVSQRYMKHKSSVSDFQSLVYGLIDPSCYKIGVLKGEFPRAPESPSLWDRLVTRRRRKSVEN